MRQEPRHGHREQPWRVSPRLMTTDMDNCTPSTDEFAVL
jgi:hypothetical protein